MIVIIIIIIIAIIIIVIVVVVVVIVIVVALLSSNQNISTLQKEVLKMRTFFAVMTVKRLVNMVCLEKMPG